MPTTDDRSLIRQVLESVKAGTMTVDGAEEILSRMKELRTPVEQPRGVDVGGGCRY